MFKIENTSDTEDLTTHLILKLTGRLDSQNSNEVEKEILSAIENRKKVSSHISLILDLEELTFISSAGLRVIFKLCKSLKGIEHRIKLENVHNNVALAFEMAGLMPGIGNDESTTFKTSEDADEFLKDIEDSETNKKNNTKKTIILKS